MKKSKKISLIASVLYIAVTALLLSLIQPMIGITSHGMPVIAYVIAVAAFLAPIIAIIIIPRIEAYEEKGE
jgi:uncharacterized paraquat-inducible protein A